MKKLNVVSLWMVSLVLLPGCDTGMNDLGELSDRELRHRNYECQMATNLGAAKLQVCANLKRECERRAKAGHYAC